MLKTEKTLINGKEFIRRFSNNNKYIKQVETGVLYEEAIDVASSGFTYEETEVEIPKNPLSK